MSITGEMLRGHTETIILKQLLTGDSYGYEINREVIEKTNGLYELNEATLYKAFRRLEDNCLVTSYWGDEDATARRKYYSITALGKQEYIRNLEEWSKVKVLIDKLITNRSRLIKKGRRD